ncbi:MAG: hypothetical protein KGY81_10590, partial [Phycisphaerae bacterium]|nr:hypothetical protein [Phycisphaerae bacterium]
MLNPAVAQYIQTHHEQMLAELAELIRFESLADAKDPDGCTPCAEWIAGRLGSLGMTADVVPAAGPPVVLGEWHVDDALPTLLCYAHYDVQPADPMEEWLSP